MTEQKKTPKKPLIFYYIIAMLVLLLLNALLFPTLLGNQVKQVDYGTFLAKIDADQVKEVEVQENEIVFVTTGDDGKEEVCVTGKMDDPDLVSRLQNSSAQFSRDIPKENSPREFPSAQLFVDLGAADPFLCSHRSASHAFHAKAHERRQRHDLRQEQRQGLCRGPNRQDLCRCGRGRRG